MQRCGFPDAWAAGRLYQVITDAHTYPEMLALARTLPATRAGQLSMAWAEQHAAQAGRGQSGLGAEGDG